MTQLCVPVFVYDAAAARADVARAAEQGADLVELRIDPWADQPENDATSADGLVALIRESTLPCIVTCRPSWEGGLYDGDDADRVALIEHLGTSCAGHGPAYFDVELAAYQRSANLRQKVHLVAEHPGLSQPRLAQGDLPGAGLILSSHDFDGRPADLLRRVADMAEQEGCRVVKVAWHARSLRDNLEAFELLAAKHKPTVALCMGEFGLPSRVLAKKFGALLTFASLGETEGTAPGQPTIHDLKTRYRWDHIGPATKVYGVIGDPVGHSLSPALHNAGFDATGFDGVYLPMRIPPEYEHFKATVDAWLNDPRLDFRGASVTIPHKQNLLRFVKEYGGEVEPLAERIGAANTLHQRDDGTLYAGNTDYAAALDAVCEGLGIEREDLAGRSFAVIGAGGAARAVVVGLSTYGAYVRVYNRDTHRACDLVTLCNAHPTRDPLPGPVRVSGLDSLNDIRRPLEQIIINCTPVGMHPKIQDAPMDIGIRVEHSGTCPLVFDTIYNPHETKLLREAKALGCPTIPGTEMFIRQAAAQFELWTERDAPIDIFRLVIQASFET